MPWCPDCKWEYVPGIERCVDCGSVLVEDDPNPAPEQKLQEAQNRGASTESGLATGCLGAILSWIVLLVLALVPEILPGDVLDPLVCLRIAACSAIGFLIGVNFKARLMPSLIGWLLASMPFLFAAGLGYAHEEPIPIPVANVIWSTILLPILLGPLSIAAGSLYTRNRRASLTLWLIPTGLSVTAVFVASRIVGLGK